MRGSFPKMVMIGAPLALVAGAVLPLGLPSHDLARRHRPESEPPLHVAVLLPSTSGQGRELLEGLRRRLLEKGPAAHRIQVLDANEREGRLVASLRRARPTVVVALGARATTLASRAADAPVVSALVLRAANVGDAGRVTGVGLEFSPETELRWLRRILPHHQRVGIVYSPAANELLVTRAREVAASLGLELVTRSVSAPAELPNALSSLVGKADVLWGIADDVVLAPEAAKPILLFSLRNRIPLIGPSTAWVRSGALYALDRDYGDLGEQCADVVLRLAAGEAPDAVAPTGPRKVVYSVNGRTAELLGIKLPQDILEGAREVVR